MMNSPLDERDSENSLLRHYRPLPDVFDEMMAADGTIRPAWQRFFDGLEGIPSSDLELRWKSAARQLHENGLTYTASRESAERPWGLDFLPLIVGADEWRRLEAGLIQRARLLNAILEDLYGPQRLIRENHIPASLIYANPHFLRPCHGIKGEHGPQLQFYAADLGRGKDGQWWVLADRTQAPSGIGYALENRIILSRCLPELFRDCHVQRLAGYFQTSHDVLVERSGRDNPRIVLLTPGPNTKEYFAHSYLARYLGYSLAEGADLTVRGSRVYLKSVDGLKPVDLIIRRIDGENCDPLELRGDSGVGVAGLLQAVRGRSVTVANAIGSGLVETKALMPFLPGLCRVLLGEELMMPSQETWWCGDDNIRDLVLNDFDGFALEHAFERQPMLGSRREAKVGADLPDFKRDALRRRIASHGFEFVARKPVHVSTTPCWVDGVIQPRVMTLRIFMAAKESSYFAMPGGLTRLTSSNDSRLISVTKGDVTKDTWVTGDAPVAPVTLLRSALSYVEPRRTGKDLPSRAADNLFWLGRYSERAENTIRGLRSILRRLTEDVSSFDDTAVMEKVVRVLLKLRNTPATPAEARAAKREDLLASHLPQLLLSSSCPYGLQETVSHLQRTASLVRDRLSHDAWRTLRHFHTEIRNFAQHGEWLGSLLDYREALEVLDEAIRTLAAFSGLEMENMTRNFGWRFLDMGRRLERAQHLAELLKALLVHGSPEEDGSLVLLLEMADSFMTYRSRYMTTPMLPPVIDLLVLDETNPRSIGFQLAAIAEHVESLPRDEETRVRSVEQKMMLSILTDIRLVDIAAIIDHDRQGRRRALDGLLERIATTLPKVSELITRTYFSHAEARRPADL